MGDVFVTGACAVVPDGGADAEDEVRRFRVAGVEYEMRSPRFPSDDLHAPAPKERKLMRQDVALALVCVGRLIQDNELDVERRRDACLYLATGLSQDRRFEESIADLCQAYLMASADDPEAERNAAFYRRLPPLMALAGLANSSASFIAKHHSVLGHNAVFGVSAHAGHAAVREGVQKLASGAAAIAVVGGANSTGKLSAVAYSAFGAERGDVRECEAAAFLLLESEESVGRSGRPVMARIADLGSVPSALGPLDEHGAPFSGIHEDRWPHGADRALVGGSPFVVDHEAAVGAVEARGVPVSSDFDGIGCPGAASVPLDLVRAVRRVADGESGSTVCLTRDVYGRESFVVVEGEAA